MAHVDQGLDAEGLAGFLEAAHHFVAVGVVGGQEGDLLAEFREGIAPHCARREVRIERLVEGVFGEVRRLVDGVGLADRIEDDLPLLGHVVDRELHRRRQAADDEVHLLLLDQFQRAGRGFARIELVVAHQQLRLAAVETAALVELGDRDFGGAHLILGLGAIGAGQRHREADLDGRFLRLQQIDAERRCRGNGARAGGRQQAAAADRPGWRFCFVGHALAPLDGFVRVILIE